jgi:fructose-1,6-bisphosphatase
VGEGYVVVLDPLDGSWGVAEATAVRGGFIMVITADTMFGALDGM